MITSDKLQKLFDAALNSPEDTFADRRNSGSSLNPTAIHESGQPSVGYSQAPAMSDSFRNLLERGMLRSTGS